MTHKGRRLLIGSSPGFKRIAEKQEENTMATQIRQSFDYEKFELHEFNRDVKKTKDLEASMREYGWISAYPMHVLKNGNGKYKIKAGHHRFTVAQKLGIPVKYVVCEDDIPIQRLEKTTVPWSVQNYHESFVRNGNPHYVAVEKYCEITGIGLSNAISLLAGETAGSNNKLNQFKAGTYKIGDRFHADVVGDIIIYLTNIGVKHSTQNLFVQAVSRCCRVSQFSVQQFKRKAKSFKALFERQATLDAYMQMIEEIYNRQSKAKIPLKHYAEEVGKKRQRTFGKS